MRFRDRREAGQRLAEALRDLEPEARAGQVVVLGIPRGAWWWPTRLPGRWKLPWM